MGTSKRIVYINESDQVFSSKNRRKSLIFFLLFFNFLFEFY